MYQGRGIAGWQSYNGAMTVVIEAFISLICLASLIVILFEAQATGGFRRRWPIAVWAGGLLALALLGVESWSDARSLMGLLGVCNFLFGAGLLVRWLLWARPTSG